VALEVTGRYRYPPANPAWLAQHVEPALEPGLPIVDPHHHLWTEPGNIYLLDEIAADAASGHNIVATVYAQAHHGYRTDGPEHLRCVGETEFAAGIARAAQERGLATRVCAGIVSFANLELGDRVAEVLDAHFMAAPDLLRGIRHGVSRDENFPEGIVLRPARRGLMADAKYREGLATVARYGLTFDAMLYHQQIPQLTDMARALPGLPVVLDHIGCILGVGPYEGRAKELFPVWRADMAELARCPNVSVKVGGFGMIVCGTRWHERPMPPSSQELAEAWRPYVETCVELFGTKRCMFESNFPVDKAMQSYGVLWNAFKRLASGASPTEKADLFHNTAARVYRLGLAV